MGLFLPGDASFRRLTYKDFVTVKRQPPGSGATAVAAQTRVGHQLQPNSFRFERSRFLKGGVFTKKEPPNVLFVLQCRQPAVFVASWVFDKPKSFQDSLL